MPCLHWPCTLRSNRSLIAVLMFIFNAGPFIGNAQESTAPSSTPTLWSSEAFTPHILLQAGTSLRLGNDPTGGMYPNAITAHTSRLQISGAFPHGFEYAVQWSFVQSPGLLDTRIGYRVNSFLAFDIGMFKTPAGQEFLTSTESTDFISSASLLRFGPKRDAGVQARIHVTDKIEVRAGVFNGTGSFLNSDNTDLLSMARVSYTSPSEKGLLAAGLSAGTDPQTQNGGSFSILGADMRIETPAFLIAAEVSYELRKLTDLSPSAKAYGFYVTAGVPLAVATYIKVRYQRVFMPTRTGPEDDVILNVSHVAGTLFAVSVECVVPVRDSFPYTVPLRVLTQVQMYL